MTTLTATIREKWVSTAKAVMLQSAKCHGITHLEPSTDPVRAGYVELRCETEDPAAVLKQLLNVQGEGGEVFVYSIT
jgi:hypothetical protein